MSEDLLCAALGAYFDWYGKKCFPRVSMWQWEQDFVVVTEAMKVWEIEVKITMADWKADQKKGKFTSTNWAKVSRFYYCVPSTLLEFGIPDWVPEEFGILEAKKVQSKGMTRLRIIERRGAKNRSTFKISEKWLLKLLKSTYYRFWRVQKHDPMAAIFVQAHEHEQSIAQQETQ